jgi:phage RecT family recombinase
MSSNLPAVQEILTAIQSTGFKQQVAQLLPPNVSQDRFTRTTMVAIQQNPEILQGDRQSLYNAICRAAADGLLPDGKQGALVIFNQKVGNGWVKGVRFMPMVEGIIHQLAKANIPTYAVSVYQNDQIEIWNDDDGQHVTHRPVVFGNRGELVGVMAVARVGSRTYVETMSIDEIERVRSASRSGDNGPWKVWYDRMAQKSVLHRLKKRLPILDMAVVDSLRDPEEDEVMPAPPPAAETPPEMPQEQPTPRKRPKVLDALKAAPEAPVEPPDEDLGMPSEDLF